jgi:hypothetical protein
VIGSTWIDVALAALNVVQTLVLAYIAAFARQHRNGTSTRSAAPPQ